MELSFTAFERKAVWSLASIFALRLLGLFMILPIFSGYANTLTGATHQKVGFALGIYGLLQACLHIPFGWLSDKFGRYPLLIVGLSSFIVGSITAAFASDINSFILARALQGAGAIGSVLLASVTDVIREELRLQAITYVGMSIGCSFILALILGPVLNSVLGVPALFALMAILGAGAICLLKPLSAQLKNLAEKPQSASNIWKDLKEVLCTTQVIRLNLGVLILHATLTALFLVVPSWLSERTGSAKLWQVYVPVLLGALLLALPALRARARKTEILYKNFKAAIGVLFVSLLILLFAQSFYITMLLGLTLYFSAFYVLESQLPALVSKFAPTQLRGSALGMYASAQFLGIFLGGSLGGWLNQHFGRLSVVAFCGIIMLLWLYVAFKPVAATTPFKQSAI